jgi:tetratricopeptide (TPR) repeat protein
MSESRHVGEQTTIDAEQAFRTALQAHQAGNLPLAESIYRQILDKFPRHGLSLHYMGVLAHQVRRYPDAERLLLASLELLRPNPVFLNNVGELFRATQRFEQAETIFRRALEIDPKAPHLHNNLALVYMDRGRPDQAIDLLKVATQLHPDDAAPFCNLALALDRCGRSSEAEPIHRNAVRLNPQLPDTHLNFANNLMALNRLPEALSRAEAGLAVAPEDADLHLVRGHVLLKQGRLREGFAEFEWRLRSNRGLVRQLPKPRWTGQRLEGRTILLYHEQGFGDDLQFVRYAPLLKQRGATVIIQSFPSLRRLFTTLRGVDRIIVESDPTPDYDYHCSLLSLPARFETDLETIPNQVPYLFADEALVQQWAQRLGPRPPALRVGLCWAGSPRHDKDRVRSLRLADLAPLAAVEGVQFYALQKGPAAAQVSERPAGMNLVPLGAEIQDFADTAAVMMNLDLTISVDTAPAHLAGALGREVWTLLASASEWRWMMQRDDSPWYPTMKLFRQPTIGDWRHVAERAAEALQGRIESGAFTSVKSV